MFTLTSCKVIAPTGTPIPAVVAALIEARKIGPVGVVSNHAKPAWFDAVFAGTRVQFLLEPGRQGGQVVARNTEKFDLKPYDAIVLAGGRDDISMAKNGGAVIVAAGWCADPEISNLGVKADTPAEFLEVVRLTSNWSGAWWYSGSAETYRVRSLTDLSSMYVDDDQAAFARQLKHTVKNGGARLKTLLTVTARSLQTEGISNTANLFWGVYPSSSPNVKSDQEVLSDFTHRLRTIASSVQMARRNTPLFIRHTRAIKRSGGTGVDRNDPAGQVETIHLNPAYRGKLNGRNVVVIDDCTTYGLSFGVAAAFLTKAGARSVTGVALGQFGNRLNDHRVVILTDPFAVVERVGGYARLGRFPMIGSFSKDAQTSLRELL